MTIFRHEMRRGRTALLVWTAGIAAMILICIMIFPEMKEQMESFSRLFASLGAFTAAFGMDRISFGDLMGFYGIECGNILGIGGALYAALLGILALSGEERNHTAEFLLTHPVSRTHVVLWKLLAAAAQIILLNAASALAAVLSAALIGEVFAWKEFLLMHLAYLLMQLEIASICFGISAFLHRGGTGIGLGLATVFYFLGLLANLSDKADFLKYITPFGYADSADIISEGRLDPALIAIGLAVSAAAIATAFYKYHKKDIAA